jgi:hypothetical protein
MNEQHEVEEIPHHAANSEDTDSAASPVTMTEDVWREMNTAMCAYYFSRISFFELLDKWETILGIQKAPKP